MAKVLLWIAAVSFAIYIVKSQYLSSKTYEPFIQACVSAGSASEARCTCLSDYIHQRYSDKEVQAMMDNRIADAAGRQQIERDVRLGSEYCAAQHPE